VKWFTLVRGKRCNERPLPGTRSAPAARRQLGKRRHHSPVVSASLTIAGHTADIGGQFRGALSQTLDTSAEYDAEDAPRIPREQQTPQALAAQQKAEIEKWWPNIKAAGIKAD
jgi:hypothetical protein